MKIKKHFQISSSIELNKMKIKNKGQISFEFVMIFTLIFLVLTSFTYIINQRLTEISIEQERLVMKHLSTNIINEIVLASSVNNNYMRKFDVPGLLLGKRYDMGILDNDLLVIKMYEGERVSREHFSVIPIKVKGTFLDNINVTNTKHCITKNNYDGIRISKNQASLDSNKDKVSYGDTFFVYISFNCVEDARSVEVTLKYDFDKLILKNAEPIVRKNSNENPLFEDYRLIYDYSNSAEKYINDGGRFTYGYLSKTCASTKLI